MSPKPENSAGAADRADGEVVRAPAAAPAAERRSAPQQPEAAPPREEIPGVTVPMPPHAGGVSVPPIGGSRTAEEAEHLALDTAAKAANAG